MVPTAVPFNGSPNITTLSISPSLKPTPRRQIKTHQTKQPSQQTPKESSLLYAPVVLLVYSTSCQDLDLFLFLVLRRRNTRISRHHNLSTRTLRHSPRSVIRKQRRPRIIAAFQEPDDRRRVRDALDGDVGCSDEGADGFEDFVVLGCVMEPGGKMEGGCLERTRWAGASSDVSGGVGAPGEEDGDFLAGDVVDEVVLGFGGESAGEEEGEGSCEGEEREEEGLGTHCDVVEGEERKGKEDGGGCDELYISEMLEDSLEMYFRVTWSSAHRAFRKLVNCLRSVGDSYWDAHCG